jgi:hypothetical protein
MDVGTNRTGRVALALAGAFLAWIPAGCECACDERGSPESAVVRGTVLDALDGEPVAGARIETPSGEVVVTDEQGRFEVVGLPAGEELDLVATREGGGSGTVHLRANRPSELEVVVHVRTP